MVTGWTPRRGGPGVSLVSSSTGYGQSREATLRRERLRYGQSREATLRGLYAKSLRQGVHDLRGATRTVTFSLSPLALKRESLKCAPRQEAFEVRARRLGRHDGRRARGH